MKKYILSTVTLFLLTLLTSCEAVETVFKGNVLGIFLNCLSGSCYILAILARKEINSLQTL